MSASKLDSKDIITSRITTSFLIYSLLSVLAWIYVIPFKKPYLVINDYYKYIELTVIILTAVFAAMTVVNYFIARKKRLKEEKIITPLMWIMYSVPTVVSAVIIPLSNNRTLTYKYCIVAFLTIFISYLMYYLLDKCFAYITPICALYCMVFAFMEYMYSFDVTFSDKIRLPYVAALVIFAIVIIATTAVIFLLYKKNKISNLYSVIILSSVAILAIIVRIFVLRFVSLIAIMLLIGAYVFICIKEKIRLKRTK